MEDPARSLTGDDPGGLGATESELDMSSEESFSESANDGFSMDAGDRARERAQGSCLNALGVDYGRQSGCA